jgi:hypothetical protein
VLREEAERLEQAPLSEIPLAPERLVLDLGDRLPRFRRKLDPLHLGETLERLAITTKRPLLSDGVEEFHGCLLRYRRTRHLCLEGGFFLARDFLLVLDFEAAFSTVFDPCLLRRDLARSSGIVNFRISCTSRLAHDSDG